MTLGVDGLIVNLYHNGALNKSDSPMFHSEEDSVSSFVSETLRIQNKRTCNKCHVDFWNATKTNTFEIDICRFERLYNNKHSGLKPSEVDIYLHVSRYWYATA